MSSFRRRRNKPEKPFSRQFVKSRSSLRAPKLKRLPWSSAKIIPTLVGRLNFHLLLLAQPNRAAELVTVEVRAQSDRDVFLAYEEGNGYLVFSCLPAPAITKGDLLSHPHWDDREGRWLTIQNLTRKRPVRIFLNGWSMSLKDACQLLGCLRVPSKIDTID